MNIYLYLMKIIDKYITFNNEKYNEMYIINSVKKLFRRAAKVNNCKGFTLAELLIVVAIIAVLIVVAIPIFVNQLEKSREASDLANVRSAYAEVMTSVIEGDTSKTVSVELSQRESDWLNDPVTIGSITHYKKDGDTVNWKGVPGNNGTCVVSYNEGTGILFTWSSASNVVKPTVKFDEDIHGALDATGYPQNVTPTNSFRIDSTCPNSTMLQDVKNQLADDSLLNNGSWTFLGDIKTSSYKCMYLFWTSVDISDKENQTVPIIVSKKGGGYYISQALVQKRTNKGKEYMVLGNEIINYKGFNSYTTGTEYGSLEDAYAAYEKEVNKNYSNNLQSCG